MQDIDMDLMRHWGRRDYVEEVVSDSDSEFGKGPLFTIKEDDEDEEGEASGEEGMEEEEDEDEDVHDEEYGNEDDDDYDLKVKNFGDSDTETTVHDSTANSTSTMNQTTASSDNILNNHSLLQVAQPSNRMGSHNYIPAAATASNANGKYRTVSVFGGILDLADPEDDSNSFSSDGFSDDEWSVEEEAPKRPKRKAAAAANTSTSRQPPAERMGFQPVKQPEAPMEVVSETFIKAKEVNHAKHDEKKEDSESIEKQSLLSNVKEELIPQTETSATSASILPAKQRQQQPSSEEETDAITEDSKTVSTIITTADIPKSIDLSKFIDKPVKEQQGLFQNFLNELCFLAVPQETDDEDLSRKPQK